jgi:elongation factor G
MPEPLLPVAIVAKSKADEDKLSQGLNRLIAEDPTLRLENNAETRQLVLWCMGEAHADVLLDRLGNRYGVAVETTDLRVPLRETIAGKAQGLGRNVKQSGGHGEYGICHIEVERLEDSASSSSTRSSAGWCPGSSSRRWKRASAGRWSRASRPATR